MVGFGSSKGLKKIEKVKMVENSTHLGEVGFLQLIHKQIHQTGRYNEIERLLWSCFLMSGWEVVWWY